VNALFHGLHEVIVAVTALDWLQNLVVFILCIHEILMAVCTIHVPMDGLVEDGLVDEEGHLHAGDSPGEVFVGMTIETLGGRKSGGRRRDEQKD
jgi:hypothetical protein